MPVGEGVERGRGRESESERQLIGQWVRYIRSWGDEEPETPLTRAQRQDPAIQRAAKFTAMRDMEETAYPASAFQILGDFDVPENVWETQEFKNAALKAARGVSQQLYYDADVAWSFAERVGISKETIEGYVKEHLRGLLIVAELGLAKKQAEKYGLPESVFAEKEVKSGANEGVAQLLSAKKFTEADAIIKICKLSKKELVDSVKQAVEYDLLGGKFRRIPAILDATGVSIDEVLSDTRMRENLMVGLEEAIRFDPEGTTEFLSKFPNLPIELIESKKLQDDAVAAIFKKLRRPYRAKTLGPFGGGKHPADQPDPSDIYVFFELFHIPEERLDDPEMQRAARNIVGANYVLGLDDRVATAMERFNLPPDVLTSPDLRGFVESRLKDEAGYILDEDHFNRLVEEAERVGVSNEELHEFIKQGYLRSASEGREGFVAENAKYGKLSDEFLSSQEVRTEAEKGLEVLRGRGASDREIRRFKKQFGLDSE